ncbi:GNAT family N-acetyltransferase [Mesorhizobium sp. VK23B]|uniref:GNAT family N-acetyltransferase n=1 Tax=Mesorhizobium dulcispinae TaxID=3072316 RepID=A0ABU4XMS1_9HYPH|nr:MULTISPECIES: GNAT family N-acetyltransferase [unclassified Mesorhizobium]MDX8469718.1 GNAT family N-acetyltransferase [Mesorhizobium sp. VK23B]MDX8476057.1 GNAT family N-acetyltransferase [Mesorhizobium sp. VK23A]
MHTLETPRLVLRPPTHSDELLVHELHSDPFVINAIRDGVYPTIEQSRATLLQFLNHWQHHRFGLWMVFVKDDGQAREFAGYCGLMCGDRYLPEDPNNALIVTCLHAAASGKGIAVEAGRAVVQFAFEFLKFEKVTGFVRPNNKRSLIKNMKIGFFYSGDALIEKNTRMRLEITPRTAVKADELRVVDCEGA